MTLGDVLKMTSEDIEFASPSKKRSILSTVRKAARERYKRISKWNIKGSAYETIKKSGGFPVVKDVPINQLVNEIRRYLIFLNDPETTAKGRKYFKGDFKAQFEADELNDRQFDQFFTVWNTIKSRHLNIINALGLYLKVREKAKEVVVNRKRGVSIDDLIDMVSEYVENLYVKEEEDEMGSENEFDKYRHG